MKIIISPSKTKNKIEEVKLEGTVPVYDEKATFIFNEMKEKSKEEIQKLLKLSDKLVDEVYSYYQDEHYNTAINMYTGFVYRGLNLNEYNGEQINYMNSAVTILSAMYGVLKPSDKVKLYRLDMKDKVSVNLYNYWQDDVNAYLDDELIINLASKEYTKLVKKEMITIEFKEWEEDHYKVCPTYSKITRGRMLDYLIKNKIENIDEIKKFKEDNYSFNNDLSTLDTLIFTRGK